MKSTAVRLRPQLFARLEESALSNRRTLTEQLNLIVEEWFDLAFGPRRLGVPEAPGKIVHSSAPAKPDWDAINRSTRKVAK